MLKFGTKNNWSTSYNHNSMDKPLSQSVLVVDDEPMARNLLRLMLIREGFDVLEAVDGNDALLVLDQHRPDLIVLDVMMPELDGMTLCESLRSRVDLADLPIIMLSARTDAKSVEQGLASGASRYLSKPISADILTSHVRDLLTMVVAPS
ncbi:MAG TPA: response regulator [Anaerolineae bacterium]|nr:response regulator [Anaerolineae bacterium]